MEFTIRNKYIKKFLSGFANHNQMKVIKYLTILGIDALKKNQHSSITFEELQNLASCSPYVVIFLIFKKKKRWYLRVLLKKRSILMMKYQ